MDDKVITDMAEKIGAMNIKIDDLSKDMSKIIKFINGNGKPQDGMLYIQQRHTTDITQLQGDIKEVKSRVGFWAKFITWMFQNPVFAVIILIAFLAVLGYSGTSILAFSHELGKVYQNLPAGH